MWESSQVGDPPLPPIWECHVFEKKKIMVYFAVFDLRNIYCWGVSHVKNSKNGSGIWVDPPPLFFSKFPHFPVLFC